MDIKTFIADIVKAKADKLSFDRFIIRVCVKYGKTAPIMEKQYLSILEDISNIPNREQRVHFWRKVRFPKVSGQLCRLFEKMEFDMNDSDSGKVTGQ